LPFKILFWFLTRFISNHEVVQAVKIEAGIGYRLMDSGRHASMKKRLERKSKQVL